MERNFFYLSSGIDYSAYYLPTLVFNTFYGKWVQDSRRLFV